MFGAFPFSLVSLDCLVSAEPPFGVESGWVSLVQTSFSPAQTNFSPALCLVWLRAVWFVFWRDCAFIYLASLVISLVI